PGHLFGGDMAAGEILSGSNEKVARRQELVHQAGYLLRGKIIHAVLIVGGRGKLCRLCPRQGKCRGCAICVSLWKCGPDCRSKGQQARNCEFLSRDKLEEMRCGGGFQ